MAWEDIWGPVLFRFVSYFGILGATLKQTQRQINLEPVKARNLPSDFSLVQIKLHDRLRLSETTALHVLFLSKVPKKKVQVRGLPHLAKNERDMGHPTIFGREKDRIGHP
jgi:hypothetical protein